MTDEFVHQSKRSSSNASGARIEVKVRCEMQTKHSGTASRLHRACGIAQALSVCVVSVFEDWHITGVPQLGCTGLAWRPVDAEATGMSIRQARVRMLVAYRSDPPGLPHGGAAPNIFHSTGRRRPSRSRHIHPSRHPEFMNPASFS